MDLWLEQRLSTALGLPVGRGAGQATGRGEKALPLRSALWLHQAQALADTLERAVRDTLFYREKLAGLNVLGPGDPAQGHAPEAARQTAARAGAQRKGRGGSSGKGRGLCAALRRSAAQGPEAAREALLETLEALPLTRPEELAAAPESFLAVPQDEVAGVISTSGTTGQGKRIFCAQEDLQSSTDFFRHGMRYLVRPGAGNSGQAAGPEAAMPGAAPRSWLPNPRLPASRLPDPLGPDARPPEVTLPGAALPDPMPSGAMLSAPMLPNRVALCMSGQRPGSVGQLFAGAMRDLGAPCLVAGFAPPDPAGGALESYLRGLLDFAPGCLVGVPGQILALARHPLGRALGKSVQSVLFSGDTAPAPLRRAVEQAWGCRVRLHYGLTEFGLGGAVECGEGSGCHGREADIFTEVSGGQILLTSLTRRAMPLLRYQCGDLGELDQSPCPCGSALWRLRPLGRDSECLDLGGGEVLKSWEADGALFALPWLCFVSLEAHYAGESARPSALKIFAGAHLRDIGREEALAQAGALLAPLRQRLEQRGIGLELALLDGLTSPMPPKRSLKKVRT
ncbi:hypothetical protein LJC36_04275 [Desulfovibrio sp. OttesenSCG-928-C14]|nr:hypothetical protein [Desulfovibrio sp. OttesenSCG-928-C14]